MNMISTGTFQPETYASTQAKSASKNFALEWGKKNAKAARAGGVSLMALSLAACGGSSSTNSNSGSSDSGSTSAVSNAFVKDVIDALSGGAGNDTFTGDASTVSAADTATGGAGSDTLKLYGNAAEPIHSGIETVYLNGNTAGFDVSDDSDVTTLHLDNVATGQTYTVTAGQAVTIENIAAGETVDIAGNDVVTQTITLDDVAGSGADATIDLNSTAQTTVTFDVSTDSQITLANTGAAVTTVNVSGAGDLEFGHGLTTITTINAGSMTGALSVDALGASNVTITGGAGDDTIATGTTLNNSDVIDGGDGDDTLAVTAAGANFIGTTAGSIDVSNIETLKITTSASTDSVDFDIFANPAEIKNVTIVADAENDAVTLTDYQGSSVTVNNGATTAEDLGLITIDLKDFSGTADAMTLNLNQKQPGTDTSTDDNMEVELDITGIETLTVNTTHVSSFGAAEDIILGANTLTAANLKTVNIAGTADLEIGAFGNTVTTVNAAAATGSVDVTMGTANTTVTGGSGADRFTYGATFNSSDTLNGGDGTDILELSYTATGGQNTDIEATSIETLELRVAGTATTSDTFDLDGLASLTSINIFQDGIGDITLQDIAGSVTTVIVDATGTPGTTAEINLELDSDTTSDALTIRMDMDNVGYEANLTANDIETLTVNFDFTGAGPTTATVDDDFIEDLDATDATSIVLDTVDIASNNDAVFDMGIINASSSVTIDLRGIDFDIGSATAFTADASLSNIDTSITALTSDTDNFDEGISFTAADSVTILLDDGRGTDGAEMTLLDLDASITDTALTAAAGDFTDANIDTIKFYDDGTNTNDIGAVIIEKFQDRTNHAATVADILDLSGLGVGGLSELVITSETMTDANVTIITSASNSNGTGDTDFDGFIMLHSVVATDITADNFIFA